MSTQRDSLSSRMAAAASSRVESDKAPGKTALRSAPARVTLNLPPAMLREVERWALDTAETLVMPRVSTQDALRAMIRACLKDEQASSAALSCIREGAELGE